jgi:hypothetical protein
MPAPGLSLVGFMEEPLALAFLQQGCVVDDPSPEALRKQWEEARKRLGDAPTPNAGNPEILDMPPDAAGHLAAVAAHPRLAGGLDGMPISFGLVEIAPLLAYQFSVDISRTKKLCAELGDPPTMATMLPVFLPTDLEAIRYQGQMQQANSAVFVSDSANFRIVQHGRVGIDENQGITYVGVGFGASSPWAQVARFAGRCYLRNGYHRLYGAKKVGATHVPAMVLDAPTWELVGAREGGATFDRALLESGNPPTMAHYTHERALPVQLRRPKRIIHVSWSEYLLLEPDPDP